MSNINPTISGYGFELDVNDISYSMFTNFIIAHEETIRSRTNYQEISLLEFIKKNRNADTIDVSDLTEIPNFADIKNDFNESRTYGIEAIIANIISNETGLRLQYEHTEDYTQTNCILLPYRAPWEYDEVEAKLNANALINMLMPYFEELGIKPTLTEIHVEYNHEFL